MNRALRPFFGPLLVAVPLAVFAAWAAGCPSTATADCKGEKCDAVVDDGPPRFFAEPPFGVGFDCVTIGCDTEKTLTIENRGGGKLGISLVRLSVSSSTDFVVTRVDGEALPCAECTTGPNGEDLEPRIALLGAGEKLELSIRYRPSDDVVDLGAVQMEHFDGALPYLESTPVVDEVPLTARAFGSPAASLPTEVLDFGFVPVGASKTLELVVDNIGNESVLRVGPVQREEGTSAAFHAPSPRDWGERFANPGEAARIPVTFAPTTSDAFIGAIALSTNDPLRPGVRVVVQGTAIPAARLGVVEPVGELLMSDVRLGQTRDGTVVVRNLGGTPLDVTADMDFFGNALGFTVAPATVSQLMPLQTAELVVTLTPVVGGNAVGTVKLTANDPTIPAGLDVVARAFVDAPQLTASPAAVSFGDIVQGWTAEPRTMTIGNSGFGELEITSIAFELGSSAQISVVDVPPLPRKLGAGETITLTFLLTATNVGPATAVLLVASDSIDVDVHRIDVFGNVITCEQGCPIANGTPQCGSGFCEVESCFNRFHNADNNAGNGCECREDFDSQSGINGDISAACGGFNMGNMGDDCQSVQNRTITGSLHSLTDRDLYFFRALDDASCNPFGNNCDCFDDSFGVRIRLLAAPPGAIVCARRAEDGAGCGGENQRICGGTELFFGGGNQVFGDDDDSDITVWVEWAPGANPVCGNYTLNIKTDDG